MILIINKVFFNFILNYAIIYKGVSNAEKTIRGEIPKQ